MYLITGKVHAAYMPTLKLLMVVLRFSAPPRVKFGMEEST